MKSKEQDEVRGDSVVLILCLPARINGEMSGDVTLQNEWESWREREAQGASK
jgi:hypothetical protein